MAEQVEETVEETTVEEVEVPAVEEVAEEEKEFKNPQARARYLERENRALEGRIEQLAGALQQIVAAQSGGQEAEIPEVEDASEEELTADPLGVIYKKLKSLERQLAENEQRQSFHAQNTSIAGALERANQMLASKLEEDRPTYESAYIHLFQVVEGEVADEAPNMTQRERYAEVTNRLNAMKLASIRANRNPADDFIRKSKRFGWVPPKARDGEEGEVDAKEQIRNAKKKTEGNRTLSTMEGGTPRIKVDFSKLKDREFNKAIDDAIKAGKFKREGNAYRTPPMRDLLSAKQLIPIE